MPMKSIGSLRMTDSTWGNSWSVITCTPMYRTRPAFFSSFRAARFVGSAAAGSMTRSIFGTLSRANNESMCPFTKAAPGCGAALPGVPRVDQKSLF
jgi:hypothetical protein